MQISIDVPKRIEEALRAELGGDLDRAAKESLAIDLYRQGRISIGFLAEMLGMGVIEADRWLAERNVPLNYSVEDFEADVKNLRELFPRDRR
jgi:predicted HTH domain antitoxin